LLLVDPFGWNLLDKASGLTDEAAGSMPPDVALYAGLDLLTFSEEVLTEFSQPFVQALAVEGVEDLGGGLERLDAMLAEETGLTLTDDVKPWLGRSVGLGISELSLLPDGRIDKLSWLVVAASQDRPAADAFLEKLASQAAELSGLEASESDYRGRSIVSFIPGAGAPLDGLAFTRSAGQVILGSDEARVRAAIDAQQGQSLADDETYRQLVGALPGDRGLTLYADQSQAPEIGRLLAIVAPVAIGPLDLTSLVMPPGGLGATIIDQGLRLDTATLTADDGGAQSPGTREMAGNLPATTLALVTGNTLEGVWNSLKGSLAAGDSLADFEESMALLTREFGYDPDSQLLPLLNEEWTLAVLPAGEGLVNELTGAPLGLVLLAGSDDATALAAAVHELSGSLEGQRLPLETVDVNGTPATFVALESLIGAPLPLYGLDGDRFFLATDVDSLALVVDGQEPLAEDENYQQALALLPETFEIGAYTDMSGLLSLIGGQSNDAAGSRSMALLSPVQSMVSGSGPASGGVHPGVLFLIIE
jgi:hypothetical protein